MRLLEEFSTHAFSNTPDTHTANATTHADTHTNTHTASSFAVPGTRLRCGGLLSAMCFKVPW